jgi:hypothetical protein
MGIQLTQPSTGSPAVAEGIEQATGGYEFSAGFVDRTTGTGGATDVGSDVLYTQTMVDNRTWYRFGFSSAQNIANDVAYWSDPTPAATAGVGLFGGSYMPSGVTNLFDFTADDADYNQATTFGSENMTAATGSFDFSECSAGDFAKVRFDFNVTPQLADTTIEIAMIWQTRAADQTPTFTFALTGTPITFGSNSVGNTFLLRPIITAYFASNEDVRARALLAVRGDQQFITQPLTTLVSIER